MRDETLLALAIDPATGEVSGDPVKVAAGVSHNGAVAVAVAVDVVVVVVGVQAVIVALAVPVASCAGVVLPGCECGSVPIAGSLMRRGVTPAAALAFLLAAPAINPIVLTATAVAFPNNPEMVVGRGVASLVVAMLMGWLWLRLGRLEWIRMPHRPELDDRSKGRAFWAACRHDIIHAGGFLVLGAMAAATINVLVPDAWLQSLADNPVLSVIALAILAVLLSICSEADAFVAASLSQFSLTSRLVFLVVGFIEVFSIMIRPFTLSVRLFGNVFGGENLLHGTGFLFVFYFMELLVGLIQAVVFTLLSSVYIGLICNHGDDHDHDHAEGHAAESHH